MIQRIERQFAGRTLSLEFGRMAKLAQGSCLVQYGDTVVLCAVTVQNKPSHLPFFPLTVEYREKSYAAGKIPGGFFKREGRPGEKEILSARCIDRPIRPLFPKGFKYETQVACFILSADQENDADTIALLAASVALNMSKIPFSTPVASVRVGRIAGNWVLNPTFQQLEYSDVDIVISGTADAITMVEGGAIEVPEDEILEALQVAHDGIKELCAMQLEFLDGHTVPDMEWTSVAPDADLQAKVSELAAAGVAEALTHGDKAERGAAMSAVTAEVIATLTAEDEAYADQSKDIGEIVRDVEKTTLRRVILETGVRPDGRGVDDIRPITSEVGVLPRTHGSALFTRGQTQALAVITLGTSRDEQRIDSIDSREEIKKSFMLHYNFPPFCVGEAKPFRGTSRREIGHGNLAERAIQPLLPAYDDFPYTIRVVSDVLESNGSSSMASVCGSSLALMDAGVPMKAPCAGVAMGLIKEGDDIAILTDILGLEDALGDMDFKIAGTRDGVTSIQMDIKIDGLTVDIMKEALQRANKGRMHILNLMDETLSAGRTELSDYAPTIVSIQINPEKIGEIIGPKGKTIRAIQEESGAQIDIDDSGIVKIAAVSGEAGARAREMIEAIVKDPEVGRIYEGPVKNTTTFGAFIEIMPGTEGLCHISELQEARTENTEDVVKKGDIVKVKLLSIDEKGRLRLSRKAALAEAAAGSDDADAEGDA
ncbi:MAG: polyribonucleotide nucleotidyltransferase [Gemmatimonadales bacterium]|jgi:polyribonucleotide nucleotidyltransferase|nr:polyribonucleotide nucleotidyltransferase [Gemmatimonadales bacterium]MBT3775548.1 polyribonucleotide nucleotidyltransferase [Gemmatimonadales bacterium]MBT3957337.1 polyribonucleotide nucleotidyltransferase [Gemmatimonadales bacterium]MBT4436155.1 polyribonucleotide nucleotidyltransferase [Gemmatimonadales bacterium]MBT4914451.1 polyribonucleotide nucleotidyltransferase [Gemmatimonadales bacterium]